MRRVRDRRQVRDDERLAVARQARLEQEGELRVAVRHVRRPLRQRHEHVRQRRQRLVDGLGLLEPLARRVRLAEPLGAREVHQVQRAVERLGLAARRPRPRDAQREDCVAAGVALSESGRRRPRKRCATEQAGRRSMGKRHGLPRLLDPVSNGLVK